MWSNSVDLLRRSAGKPIRVASKSVRSRALLRTILDRDAGYQGLLTFTLPETLWSPARGSPPRRGLPDDRPRRAARARGAHRRRPRRRTGGDGRLTAHLDLIEDRRHGRRADRVCLDFDVALWVAGDRVKIGAKRTPIHTPEHAGRFAEEISARPGLVLAGMMSYEGHIAGQGDRIAGARLKSLVIARMQKTSYAELRERRAAAVAAVREVADLAFVNAGGTAISSASRPSPR